jgi:hypothetical protein
MVKKPSARKQFFFEKRTKKLLLCLVRTDQIGRVNQRNKSFLMLFFKKERLAYLRRPSD